MLGHLALGFSTSKFHPFSPNLWCALCRAGHIVGAGGVSNCDGDVIVAQSRSGSSPEQAHQAGRDNGLPLRGRAWHRDPFVEVVQLVGLFCVLQVSLWARVKQVTAGGGGGNIPGPR